MISTLTIGKNASVLDLSPKLKGAPFDVLLVMMTPQVTDLTPAYKLLTILADSNLDMLTVGKPAVEIEAR